MAKYTQLCHHVYSKDKKTITVTGPISPVMIIEDVGKYFDFKYPLISGIIRVKNTQSYDHTYDHLVFMPHTNICVMIVDMGDTYFPVCIYFTDEKYAQLTPIYKDNITEKYMEQHRRNMECPKRCQDNPIMRLTEKQLQDLMQDIIDSNIFLNRNNYAKRKSILPDSIS